MVLMSVFRSVSDLIGPQSATFKRRLGLLCQRPYGGYSSRLAAVWSTQTRAVAISVIVLFTSSGDTRADVVNYDPSQCATDPQGTVTIALDRIVLRVPMGDLGYIQDMAPEHRSLLPEPPDPLQPEGCPDNPMRGRGFHIRYSPDLAGGDAPQQAPQWSLDRLVLIAVPVDYWGTQPSNESLFEHLCEEDDLRDEMDNGLIVCTGRPVPPLDTTRTPDDWPFSAQAPLEVYEAPFGRPFTVVCWWGDSYRSGVIGRNQCDVVYKLYETVNITYRFQPRNLPISSLLEFDRGLRVWITSTRVEDFRWPDQAPTTGEN